MTFLDKIFGGKKKDSKSEDAVMDLVEDSAAKLIEYSGMAIDFEIFREEDGSMVVDLSGPDEEMMIAREGQMLDAIQLFLQRVVQHQMSEERTIVHVDCGGFREEADQALMDLADKLKDIALTKGKSVYFRALPPKDRKVVHQYLAEDGRVKSRSIGDGHFKKIKIFPIKDDAAMKDGESSH